MVDAIRQHGAGIEADLEELWRRIVFYILISNTDDHLRNLGFLYAAAQKGALANLESYLVGSAGGTIRKGELAVRARSTSVEPIAVPRRHRWNLLPQLDAKVA